MTSTISTETALILKSDALGRVRTPPEQREAILDEFERSGMSGAAFARAHGIKYPTFASWVSARRRTAEQSTEGSGFAEVIIPSRERLSGEEAEWSESEGLQIELPSGARIIVRGANEARLAGTVLSALQVS